MDFGPTISNALLQVAVGAGEATLRHACGSADDVAIHVELMQFADGRDAIHVALCGNQWSGEFTMLLRNYFNRQILWRMARRAWLNRAIGDETASRRLEFLPTASVAALN